MWLDKYHEHEGKSYRLFQTDIGAEVFYVLVPDEKRVTWCGKMVYVTKGEEPKETRKRRKKEEIENGLQEADRVDLGTG